MKNLLLKTNNFRRQSIKIQACKNSIDLGMFFDNIKFSLIFQEKIGKQVLTPNNYF